MTAGNILIVEDETPIREMVGFALRRAGFNLAEAANGKDAQMRVGERLPDIVLMDWMLPDISGIELVRQFKRDELTRGIPIIMLTARSEEEDKIYGLDTGADDYVTKPFSPKELVARIRAILRRHGGGNAKDETVAVGALQIDSGSHRVHAGEHEIQIGPTEYKLLEFFMTHRDRVYSRAQLLDHVWGRNAYVEDRTVDVHVLRLRKLLKPYDFDKMIQTVRGSGYRFSEKH
jgi:two-component system phosphate regulon response regulator PhoB